MLSGPTHIPAPPGAATLSLGETCHARGSNAAADWYDKKYPTAHRLFRGTDIRGLKVHGVGTPDELAIIWCGNTSLPNQQILESLVVDGARAARRLVPSLASELRGVDVTEYPGYACERGGSFVRVSRPALLERLSSAYGCTDPKDQVEFLRGELLHEAVHRERDSKFDEGAQMSLDGLHSMEIPAYLVG